MKNLKTLGKSALLILSAVLAHQAEAKTYIAAQHGKYTDPTIWQPAYPGNKLSAEDSIIITSQVTLNTPLTIEGVLSVEKGAALQGNKDVYVSTSGKIFNQGNTVVRRLANEGRLDNQLVFETMLEIDNKGIINSTSTTLAGSSLLNSNGVLSGNKGTYISNSTIITSPSSIYEKGLKVFEASYTNPMADIDEALFCSSMLNVQPVSASANRIELMNSTSENFKSIVIEKSLDGVNYQPIAELNAANTSIADEQLSSPNNYYRAFAYDAYGRKYRIAATFVKNSAVGETLSMASRISY